MSDKNLLVGWASRDVSTELPVGIRGQFHLRISEGILDPLTVTALAIANAQDAVVFLSCDTTVICPFLVKLIREKVGALAPSVPVAKIVMNATHTHDAGDIFGGDESYPTPPKMTSAEYIELFASRAAAAVVEAWNSREPGGVAWGYGFAPVGHSRRVVYLDDTSKRPGAAARGGMMVNGHAVMYGNTNDPTFSHFEAGADPSLNVLFTYGAANQLTGALVNVPCPSQVDESIWKLSADFWHQARVELRKRFGEKLFVLPQCGASGDLSPHPLNNKAAIKRRLELKGATARQDIAERIAAGVAEVASWACKDIRREAELGHVVKTIELTRRPVSKKEYEAELENLAELGEVQPSADPDPIKRMMADSTLAARRGRCQGVIKRHESKETKQPLETHVVRLGDIAFATLGLELFMDYAHRVQARSPAVQTFVVQLAGGSELGGNYLPTARGEEGGGYSASVYCNMVNSTGGQEFVEETLGSLGTLFVKNA